MRVNGAGSIHARASKSCSRKPHSTRKSERDQPVDRRLRGRLQMAVHVRAVRIAHPLVGCARLAADIRNRLRRMARVARPNHHRQETAHEIGARVDQRAVDGQRARRAVADPHERIGVRAEIDDDLRIDQMHGLGLRRLSRTPRRPRRARAPRSRSRTRAGRAQTMRAGATFTFVGQVDPFGVAVPGLPARARSGSLSARPPARSRC